MKYCSHCGKEVADGATICINCGCMLSSEATPATTKSQKSDKMIPIVAFVLSIVAAFLIIVSYCSAFTTNSFLFYVGVSLLIIGIPLEFGLNIASLICGIISLAKIKEGKANGKGFALTAIVLSAALIVAVVVLVIIYFLCYESLPIARIS